MNLKVSDWLSLQDEKFLSMVKDKDKRIKLLNQLYNLRIALVLSFLIPVALFIIQLVALIFDGPGAIFEIILAIVLVLMLSYFWTDSTIRAIRLYELLLAVDQEP